MQFYIDWVAIAAIAQSVSAIVMAVSVIRLARESKKATIRSELAMSNLERQRLESDITLLRLKRGGEVREAREDQIRARIEEVSASITELRKKL